MFTSDLFEKILLEPVRAGANHLYIVSGYATPSIVYKHLQTVFDELKVDVDIELIVGMAASDGIPKASHQQFCQLVSTHSKGKFRCRYLRAMPSVHSKVYTWFSDDRPLLAYTGSANYSHSGFFRQREAMASDNPRQAYSYYQSIIGESIDCLDTAVDSHIPLTDAQVRHAKRQVRRKKAVSDLPRAVSAAQLIAQPVTISFLDKNGRLPTRSGLNWGQRPEYNRNPSQAYIRVPSAIRNAGFFPPRKHHFTIVTDDGSSLDAVVAQDNDKAIETTFDNSALGRYFRKRLGLSESALVTLADLNRYGRTDIEFVKIDDETYYMDFSV